LFIVEESAGMKAESWQLVSLVPKISKQGLPLSEIYNPVFGFFLYCGTKNEVKQRKQMVQKCPLILRI